MKVGMLAAAQLLRVLPRARISRAVGRLADRPLPPSVAKAVVSLYARAWDVDMSEAEWPPQNGAAPSFDEFFTRRLRPGARVFPSRSDQLLSPADGLLQSLGAIDDDGRLLVKDKPYRVADLLDDEEAAEPYRRGQFAVIYLSPRDYHRVHSPTHGRLAELRSAPGDLFPVNRLGERIPGLLSRNRRVALTLDTDCFGRIAVVMVAAMVVGRITVAGFDDDVPLGHHRIGSPAELVAGDELGVFHLGSSVVLLLPARAAAPLRRDAGPIRVGDLLAEPMAKAGVDEPLAQGTGRDT